MSFLLPILGLIAGFGFIVYTEKVGNFVGSISFAEKFFGSGGTYTFLKLLGVSLIIFSIISIFGSPITFFREKFDKLL